MGSSARLIWQPSPENVDGYIISRSLTNNIQASHEIARVNNQGEFISGETMGTVSFAEGRFNFLNNSGVVPPNRFFLYQVLPFNSDFPNGFGTAGASSHVYVSAVMENPSNGGVLTLIANSVTTWPISSSIEFQGGSRFFRIDAADSFNLEWRDRKNQPENAQGNWVDVRVRVRKTDYSTVQRDYTVSPSEVDAFGTLGPFEPGLYIVEVRSVLFGADQLGSYRIRARRSN